MRKLKIDTSLLLLLLFSIFACDNQQVSEDEIPLDIRSSTGTRSGSGPSQQTSQTMAVSVRFSDLTDRAFFRSQFQNILGIQIWQICSTHDNIEIWTVNLLSEEEFDKKVSSVGDYVVYPPPSAGSVGADDVFAGTQYLSLAPSFHFGKICF